MGLSISGNYISSIYQLDQSVRPSTVLIETQRKANDNDDNFLFSGLDIATDGRYELLFDLENANATGSDAGIALNGDEANANYYYQKVLSGSTTMSAGRVNSLNFLAMGANGVLSGKINISQNVAGFGCIISEYMQDITTALKTQYAVMKTTNPIANITDIKIFTYGGAKFKTGSTISLYKLTK